MRKPRTKTPGRRRASFRLWQRSDRNGVFYFALPGDVWRSTHCTDRDAAEQHANDALNAKRIAMQMHLPVVDVREKAIEASQTLLEYARSFYVWEQGKQPECPRCRRKLTEGRVIGPEHAKRQRRLYERFILKKPGPPDPIASKPIGQIVRGDLEAFRQRVLVACGADITDPDNPAGKQTARLVMMMLSGIFSEAKLQGHIPGNPAERMTVATTSRPRGILSRKELQAMFPPAPAKLGPWSSLHAKTAFLLAGTCGLRRNEVRALRWENVDLAAGELHVVEAFKGNSRRGKPKWNKTRSGLRLPTITAMHLKALGPGKGLVFCYADDSPFGVQWWEGAWNRAMTALGIDGKKRRLVPHSLRHSLASEARAEGVADVLLKGTFGWTSDAVMETYSGHQTETGSKTVANVVDMVLGSSKRKRA